MNQFSTIIGIDLGDTFNYFHVVNAAGELVQEGRVRCNLDAMSTFFAQYETPSLVAIETGTHSRWVSRVGEANGHEVLVANARKVRAIYTNERKSDALDAKMLARIARMDPQLLSPISHRGGQAQTDLALLKAREVLVAQRTQLINHIRGVVKSMGARLPSCSAPSFHKKTVEHVPEELRPALAPLYEQLEDTTRRIREYERLCQQRAEEEYTETELLQSVPGVGPLTSLAFVLTLESPDRFKDSRNVPAYLGLVPRRDQSGERDPQLRISKAGDEFLRRLLVSCAHYILGPHGPDSELRQWGERIVARGGRFAKRRAVIAVARKLAVILHQMWKTGMLWEPFPHAPDEDKESVPEDAALAGVPV